MVCKDEVCLWFKDNEPHRRLELLCGLLNMCLPMELRFISTCVEDLGKRDFHDLREAEYKANNTQEISRLSNLLDERTRSNLIVFTALLKSRNHTCSTLLYQILAEAQQIPPSADVNYVKEMLLIYTMVLHHPAFTFEQKRVIAELHTSACRLEVQLCQRQRTAETDLIDALSSQTCSPNIEGCDSGLSVGTEPEGDALLDNCGLLPTPRSQLHHHYHHHSHSLPPGVSGHGVSQTTGDSGGSQDACSSGSGESSELYNEGGTVSTTYIYNSSIFEQPGLVALTMAPSYPCNHPGNFHYYQYPQMVGAVPGCMPEGKRSNSDGSSSEESGGGLVNHNGPPASNSPLSSPQSSPYVSPLQSLSPSRASSPLSRPTTTTTTTTTTTAANLPLTITSSTSTTSASIISSVHSSAQPAHKHAIVVTQTVTTTQAGTNHSNTPLGTTSLVQSHRGKPPSSGSRSQRQSERSGSRTRVPGGSSGGDVEGTVGNQSHQNSPSASRGVMQSSLTFSSSSNHPKNSSRWSGNSTAVTTSSTSSSSSSAASTSNIKNVTRQNSQSPCPTSDITTTTSRTGVTASVTASSSTCKTNSISSHTVSGLLSSTPLSLSATQTNRNTSPPVVQGGNLEKCVQTISSNSGIRQPSSTGSSSSTNQSTSEKCAVNNNNCLNPEFVKHERLNKYYQQLSGYPIDKLKKMSDRDLIDLGLTKGALTKLRRVLTGLESPAHHIPNGFTNPSTITSHPRSTPQTYHTPYNTSHNSTHNHSTTTSLASHNSQSLTQNSSHSTMLNHTKPCLSNDTSNAHSCSQTSSSNIRTSQTSLQNQVSEINSTNKTLQTTPLNPPIRQIPSQGTCSQPSSNISTIPTSTICSSQNISSVLPTTTTTSTCITTPSSTSTPPISSLSSSTTFSAFTTTTTTSTTTTAATTTTTTTTVATTATTSSCPPPSPYIISSVTTASASVSTVFTSGSIVVTTTTTSANIAATTHVTQCHILSPSPKGVSVMSQQSPINSSTNVGKTPSTTSISSSTSSSNSPCSSLSSVAPVTPVPHYMTTPPPPIHHKTPPLPTGAATNPGQHHMTAQLPPGQHRTPPPPLCPPPRTPSREPSTPNTSTGLTLSNGIQQVYYTINNGPGGKSTCSNNMGASGPVPINMAGYGSPMGMTLPQPSPVGSVAMPIYTSAGNMPVYTSSGSIGVPPPGNGGLVPMVPPGGQFPPTYLYSLLGAPGTAHTYVPPGTYAAHHPHRSFYLPHLPSIGPMAHLKATHPHPGVPINSGNGSRGGSSSSSSSCSSGSMRGFNKGNQRGHGHMKTCSRSSDSSPSSSQYSSPPQTPSPDHTRDNQTDKRGKAQRDGIDTCEAGDSLGLLGSGASEEGTPPPLHHHPNPILLPPQASLTRPRIMPYPHLGYVGFHPGGGMIRYPSLPLPPQTQVVAPRNPVPLNSDKSSRETTPPAPGAVPLVQQDPQCCLRSPSDVSTVPSTLTGNNLGRNGGSPHNAAPHPDGPQPPAPHTPVPSVASAPTAQAAPSNSCTGAPHSSVQYNAPGYPVVMGAPMFQQFPGFMPAHSSALSNGFVSPSLPPNFAFPAMGNGINAEFVYSGQYPLLGGTTQGGGGPGTACGTPPGIGPPSTPGQGLPAGLPYSHYPPALPHTPNPSAGAKKTCYNCGQHQARHVENSSCKTTTKLVRDVREPAGTLVSRAIARQSRHIFCELLARYSKCS